MTDTQVTGVTSDPAEFSLEVEPRDAPEAVRYKGFAPCMTASVLR
jgi:hypothetical protein